MHALGLPSLQNGEPNKLLLSVSYAVRAVRSVTTAEDAPRPLPPGGGRAVPGCAEAVRKLQNSPGRDNKGLDKEHGKWG